MKTDEAIRATESIITDAPFSKEVAEVRSIHDRVIVQILELSRSGSPFGDQKAEITTVDLAVEVEIALAPSETPKRG